MISIIQITPTSMIGHWVQYARQTKTNTLHILMLYIESNCIKTTKHFYLFDLVYTLGTT